MLKYAEINILDITVKHLDSTIVHIRRLFHIWTSIFLREAIALRGTDMAPKWGHVYGARQKFLNSRKTKG